MSDALDPKVPWAHASAVLTPPSHQGIEMICGAIGVAANGSIGFQRRAGKAGRSNETHDSDFAIVMP